MIAASHLTTLAAQIVLASLWQGALLASIIALGLHLAPRLAPAHRFLIWTITLGAIVALPLITASGVLSRSVAASASPILHLSSFWGFALAGIWLSLCLYRFLELGIGAHHLLRIAKEAQPLTADPSVTALLLSSPRPVQLCISSAVDAPCIAGFTAPRLLLPATLAPTLEPSDLHAIVLHELEHLRRGDPWFNLASKLVIALFPFNPSLLWLDRRLGLERELACDASVIAITHSALTYARSLTQLAEDRTARRLAFALAAWERQSEMVQRVSALLRPVPPAGPRQRRTAVAGLAAALLAVSFGLMRTPALISFAPTGHADLTLAGATAAPAVSSVPDRPAALLTAFHPQQATAQIRSTNATFVRAIAHSSSSPSIAIKPGTTQALNVRFTSAPRPSHTDLRPRRVPARQPSARLLQTDFRTFAAVPFGDGWLIVQL